MIVDDGEVAARLKALADQLQAKGLLGDPRWREAFLAVRRHVFVPRFWRDEAPGVFPARWRMVDNATVEHPDWLDAVYSNVTLATEPTGVPAHSRPVPVAPPGRRAAAHCHTRRHSAAVPGRRFG